MRKYLRQLPIGVDTSPNFGESRGEGRFLLGKLGAGLIDGDGCYADILSWSPLGDLRQPGLADDQKLRIAAGDGAIGADDDQLSGWRDLTTPDNLRLAREFLGMRERGIGDGSNSDPVHERRELKFFWPDGGKLMGIGAEAGSDQRIGNGIVIDATLAPGRSPLDVDAAAVGRHSNHNSVTGSDSADGVGGSGFFTHRELDDGTDCRDVSVGFGDKHGGGEGQFPQARILIPSDESVGYPKGIRVERASGRDTESSTARASGGHAMDASERRH